MSWIRFPPGAPSFLINVLAEGSMTRINLIPPTELYDQHLIAEYREIRLLTSLMRRMFATSGATKAKIPSKFTLNAGHVTFFKDKGCYINKRYKNLIVEMRIRGFTPHHTEIDTTVWPTGFFNDWEPSERDCNIVRQRIAERIAQKPSWYRYYGKSTERTTS